MRWFPVALSILAADTSAISYLGYAGWSFRENVRYNLNIFTYLLAIPIVIVVFLPIYSRGNLYTAYQYLETRFDLRVRLLTTFFFILIRGVHVAVVLYAPALMLAAIMGLPLHVSIVIMGILTTVYTAAGGIKGVIWTDAVQMAMILTGFTVVMTSALHHIPGGLAEVLRVGSAHGKFDLFDFSGHWGRDDNTWAMLIGGTLIGVQAMSTDQTVLQKYFTTKSGKETSKALLFYGAITIPFMTALSFLGVVLYVLYSQHPELMNSLKNADAVIPHYAAHALPHGLIGLIVVTILAGAMSTLSASLNSLATSTVVDLYQRLQRDPKPLADYTRVSRWMTFAWGVLGCVGALYAGRLGPLIVGFSKVQSLMGGVILGIFALGVLSRRATANGVIVGAAFGLAAVLLVSVSARVSLFLYSPIGCLGTMITGWAASYIENGWAPPNATSIPRIT
jgi:SSS family transporter